MLKLVATDLDGTFLKNDKSISIENERALKILGETGIIRVVATGRNLKKTQEVIANHIPFDYVVFSSGAGIYDCKNEKLIFRQNIDRLVVDQLSGFLIERDFNFQLFKPVPGNFKSWYYRGSVPCAEFEKYFGYHQMYAEPFPMNQKIDSDACQFLVIFQNNMNHFQSLADEIQQNFPDVKVVRTSSPLDTGYIWMEIFHQTVSKGNGVKFLCDLLNIEHEYTLGIGNDYNDLDLLGFTNYSYMVENGPNELKGRFLPASSNEESAFANVLGRFL